jgi:hypothetical protein
VIRTVEIAGVPPIAAKDKEGKANVPWKERKRRLRLPTDWNPDTQKCRCWESG